MRIAVIGTGKMDRGFASALSSQHKVVFGSRDPERARKVLRSTGAAAASSYADAGAEVVILAVPWHAMEETLSRLGDLVRFVLVDVSVLARDMGFHPVDMGPLRES